MPRRIPDYALQFADFNMIVFHRRLYVRLFPAAVSVPVLIKTIRSGKPATSRVWESAHGLEWTMPSPAPYHTFTEPPTITEAEAHS